MRIKSDRGFTMIEMATIIVIVGLLLGAYFSMDRVYRARQNYQLTLNNIEAIRQALLEYQANNGRYPQPAAMTEGPSSPIFGVETAVVANVGDCNGYGQCRLSSGDATFTSPALGTHDYDKDHNPDTFVIGAVPFVTLSQANTSNKVTAAQVADSWGNKIVYAVTETMTNPGTFNPAHGVIHVVDEHNNEILDPVDGAHFILMSYGQDGQGAFSLDGSQPQPCSLARTTELPNCLKLQHVTQGNNATFVSGLRSISESSDSTYYDDIIKYQTWSMSSLWSFSSVPDSAYNLNPGNVGVNTGTPNNALDINGKFKGRNVDAKQLCDAVGNNCYDPDIIAGTALNSCGSNAAMTALGPRAGVHDDVQAECAAAVIPPVVNYSCPAGQYVAGLSSVTGVICCAVGDTTCP